MVRLLQNPILWGKPLHLVFQSHNGAIAAEVRPVFCPPVSGFNPTMVRLLLAIYFYEE